MLAIGLGLGLLLMAGVLAGVLAGLLPWPLLLLPLLQLRFYLYFFCLFLNES